MATDTMSKISCILCVACISVCWLVGCSRRDKAAEHVPNDTGHPAQQAIRSTDDVRRLLIPTLETTKIVEVLGEPCWKEDLGNGQQVWHFSLPPFPADDAMQGSSVVGVAVAITNGRVASWGCIYVSSANEAVSRERTVLAGNKGEADSPTLQFFLVSSDPINDGRFIDTERFPKLGFVARTPTLAIRRLKEVTLEERVLSQGRSRTNWSFGIFLAEEDGAKLKAITATNVSKKLLIMLGDEPVSAPTIRAPLENGRVMIECDDRSLMESVKKHLAELERQGH
jgi:hypothetical protein